MSNAGGIPDLKLLYRGILKKTWYWQENSQVEQWIRIEDPEININSYRHLILKKGTKIYITEKTVSSRNDVGKPGYLYIGEWN
jgi:hypothetical protein